MMLWSFILFLLKKMPHTNVRYSGINPSWLHFISIPNKSLAVLLMSNPIASNDGRTLSGCLQGLPSILAHAAPPQ